MDLTDDFWQLVDAGVEAGEGLLSVKLEKGQKKVSNPIEGRAEVAMHQARAEQLFLSIVERDASAQQ